MNKDLSAFLQLWHTELGSAIEAIFVLAKNAHNQENRDSVVKVASFLKKSAKLLRMCDRYNENINQQGCNSPCTKK